MPARPAVRGLGVDEQKGTLLQVQYHLRSGGRLVPASEEGNGGQA